MWSPLTHTFLCTNVTIHLNCNCRILKLYFSILNSLPPRYDSRISTPHPGSELRQWKLGIRCKLVRMREQPAPRASDSCSLPTKLANIHPVLFSSFQGPSFGIGKSTSPVELTAQVLAAPREAVTPAAGGWAACSQGPPGAPCVGL